MAPVPPWGKSLRRDECGSKLVSITAGVATLLLVGWSSGGGADAFVLTDRSPNAVQSMPNW